jgi:hypothetical protein
MFDRLVLATLLVALAPCAAAATYKWVDEKGVVHYTDKIPPEAVEKRQRAARQERRAGQAHRRGTQRRAEARQGPKRRRARSSWQGTASSSTGVTARSCPTYTMESEIDLARRRALATIDQQIQSSVAYTVQLNKRKEDLEAKKTALKPANRPPPVLENEIATISTELARQSDLVAAKQKEVVLVNVRYDADLKRWRELRAATEAQLNATANKAAAEAKSPPSKASTAQK